MKIMENKKDWSQRNTLRGFEVFQKSDTEGYSWKCIQLLGVQTDYSTQRWCADHEVLENMKCI